VIKNFWFSLSGLILGLALGILVAWIFAPVQYVDTTPSTLRVDFKDEYRLLIASAYASNLDILRARARIETLGDQDPITAIAAQAQRLMAENNPAGGIQVLANLSEALQATPVVEFTRTPEATSTETGTATDAVSPTEPTQTPTATLYVPTELISTLTPTATPAATATFTTSPTPKPIPTIAPRPTQTLTPTPATVFEFTKKTISCDPAQPGLLKVLLTNSAGKPAPGIELNITWVGGNESFFTGLKPEMGYGYADFKMADNTEYALSLSGGATRITGLTTSKCPDGTNSGGILLEFKQP